MAKDFAKSFYKSAAWEKCRASFIAERIQIDGGVCERCHKAPGFIVHHKVWLNAINIADPNVSLNHSNLEYLCHECHDSEHLPARQFGLRCGFDENGRPMQ